LCACFAHSRPRRTPLQLFEQDGTATRFNHALAFQTCFPQTEQTTSTRPRRHSGGFFFLGLRANATAHPREQITFRCAWVQLWHGKGRKQTLHVFHHGYTHFALKCLGVLECVASASFNKAAVVSGYELVCTIRLNSEGGIAVVIGEDFPDRFPAEGVVT
jgi:hypothetical protein